MEVDVVAPLKYDALIDAIEAYPPYRTVQHCGEPFQVSSLEMHSTCPKCGQDIKTRSFGGMLEIPDFINSVLAWMLDPERERVAMAMMERLRAAGRE